MAETFNFLSYKRKKKEEEKSYRSVRIFDLNWKARGCY